MLVLLYHQKGLLTMTQSSTISASSSAQYRGSRSPRSSP